MEVSCCSVRQLQRNNSLLLFESLLEKSSARDPAPDTGYFSAGSSLSPTSSVDTFCFSPSSVQAAEGDLDTLNCFMFSGPPAPHFSCSRSCTTSTTKKSRSRYPGKKRQTASEREKLRMRDLTKALHHLRTYLPNSVAPAGQILTKIETLRLTIRYISYLSAQLGLSQEVLEQRRACGYMDQPQSLRQILDHLRESDCNRAELTCVQASHQVR
ncbi:mesoderm posterior protein 2-like [Thalassophryne amazonica]|uniref:mesoderm posterior protein 2-like n=1 Tax=Thalassophryne amazonica TaxID=390379 RepID=UPI001471226F|nr:mesoderm posterior protein 2-like [Thalassophryne amazonica]